MTDPATIGQPFDQGRLNVQISSLEGSLTHPFGESNTVGDVHQFAYTHLIEKKGIVPFDRTWIEHSEQKQEDSVRLSTFGVNPQPGSQPDLSFVLAWDTGGGMV